MQQGFCPGIQLCHWGHQGRAGWTESKGRYTIEIIERVDTDTRAGIWEDEEDLKILI
jgi:hypothetical protein